MLFKVIPLNVKERYVNQPAMSSSTTASSGSSFSTLTLVFLKRICVKERLILYKEQFYSVQRTVLLCTKNRFILYKELLYYVQRTALFCTRNSFILYKEQLYSVLW